MLDAGDAQMAKGVTELLRSCVDRDIAVAAGDPRQPADLFPGEEAAILRAVSKRRIEFAAGRFVARSALAALGRPAQPILAATDRAPIWPKGIAGSISHCDTACIAAVAPTKDVRSIGIDIEPNTPLDFDLFDLVCPAPEQAWLAQQPKPGMFAKIIFCVKEAAYKAQYPLTGALFGFERFIAELDCKSGEFQVSFTQDTGCFGTGDTLQGRFAYDTDYIVAGLTLRRI